MNGLWASLLREGVTLIARGQLARQSFRYGIEHILMYGVIAILGSIALVFFYLALFWSLAKTMDDATAAAIVCAGTLAVIGLFLLVRTLITNRGRSSLSGRPDSGATHQLDAAIALGRKIEEELRKAAPEMTVAAGLIGLVIGAAPQLLDLFLPRRRDGR